MTCRSRTARHRQRPSPYRRGPAGTGQVTQPPGTTRTAGSTPSRHTSPVTKLCNETKRSVPGHPTTTRRNIQPCRDCYMAMMVGASRMITKSKLGGGPTACSNVLMTLRGLSLGPEM